MPATYYTTLLPGPRGGPVIQATFVDENPFIIAYNSTTNKYHSNYYVSTAGPHHVPLGREDLQACLSEFPGSHAPAAAVYCL